MIKARNSSFIEGVVSAARTKSLKTFFGLCDFYFNDQFDLTLLSVNSQVKL